MQSFDRSGIEKILNETDIVEVISQFVDLKKTGSQYKGLSPFKSEKTASFFVIPSKNIYKCFSSGNGGDVISFLMSVNGWSFGESMDYLKSRLGISTEFKPGVVTPEDAKMNSLMAVNKIIQGEFEKIADYKFFSDKKYAISEETQKEFGVGQGSRKHAIEALQAKGINLSLIDEAGHNKDDVYNGRITIPIKSESGSIISFSGRAMGEEKPKYRNGSSSQLFSKSEVLYGLDLARHEMRRTSACYLVEGYTDVMAVHEKVAKNVVGSMGTSLTKGQLNAISRYCDHVILCFDGDGPGTDATVRAIPDIIAAGLTVSIISIPNGNDPCSHLAAEDDLPLAMEFDEFLRTRRGVLKLSEYLAEISGYISAIESLENELIKSVYVNEIIKSI